MAREAFTRPSDLVARFSADPNTMGWWERGVLSPLRSLATTLTPAANTLWATLSVFGDRPFSPSCLPALTEAPPDHTARALSELYEVHLVRSAPGAAAALRLGALAASLGQLALGERREAVSARLAALGLG